MTLIRLAGMTRYWEKNPPTHISVHMLRRAFVEVKQEQTKDSSDILKDFPQGF